MTMRTCEVHLSLPWDDVRGEVRDLDTCHVVQSTIDPDGSSFYLRTKNGSDIFNQLLSSRPGYQTHIVVNGVLDVVPRRVHRLCHGEKAGFHHVAHALLLLDDLLQNLPAWIPAGVQNYAARCQAIATDYL